MSKPRLHVQMRAWGGGNAHAAVCKFLLQARPLESWTVLRRLTPSAGSAD